MTEFHGRAIPLQSLLWPSHCCD